MGEAFQLLMADCIIPRLNLDAKNDRDQFRSTFVYTTDVNIKLSTVLAQVEKWHLERADEQVLVALQDTSAFWKAVSARKSLMDRGFSGRASQSNRKKNNKSVKAEQKGGTIPLSFLSLDAWIEFLSNVSLLDEQITKQQAKMIFVESRMWGSFDKASHVGLM